MKAYIVTLDDSEGKTGIYFGNKPSQAKSQALADMDCEYIDLECRREPSLDKFAPGPIYIKDLIERGWWFYCFDCSGRIDEDGHYDEEKDTYTKPIYIDNNYDYLGVRGEIFCCQECLDNRDRERREIKENKEKAEKTIKERFPEAKIIHCLSNPNRMPTYLDFTLPGIDGSIGWNTEDKEYLVRQCDVEKFQEYKNAQSKQ